MGSSWLVLGTVILLAVPLLIGGYFVQLHLRRMVIQLRKEWGILLLYGLMACFVPFVNSDGDFDTWVLITAPVAAFTASAYFYISKKWLSFTLFFVTVAFTLFVEYGTAQWQ
jgi:hypothetical protein